MTYALHSPLSMPRNFVNSPGRPRKEGETFSEERAIKLAPSMMAALSDRKKETGVPVAELIRRAVAKDLSGGFDAERERAVTEALALARSIDGIDDFAAPDVGEARCGPWKEAVAEAGEFVISRATKEFLGIQDGDFWVTAVGDSMEGKGIFDGAKVAVRPFGEFATPSPGEVVLLESRVPDEEPTYTLKKWVRSTPLRVENGEGEEWPFPDGAAVRPVALLVATLTRARDLRR